MRTADDRLRPIADIQAVSLSMLMSQFTWHSILLTAFAMVSCDSPPQPTKSRLASVPVERCADFGGKVEVRGVWVERPTCIVPTKDANKPCSDSSQCIGRCIDKSDETVGITKNGRCEADNDTAGCFSEVQQGKRTGMICVD